eukprot:scaffold95861_cov47-Phaeocystis_antarctica.AAC.2
MCSVGQAVLYSRGLQRRLGAGMVGRWHSMVGDGTASELQGTATLQQTDSQTDRHRGNHGVIMPRVRNRTQSRESGEAGTLLLGRLERRPDRQIHAGAKDREQQRGRAQGQPPVGPASARAVLIDEC